MKRILVLALVPLFLVACTILPFAQNGFMYEALKKTTPVISSGAARALNMADAPRAMVPGDNTYRMYTIFQNYVYPDDEGKIDSGNLYKLLYESSQIFINRHPEAQAITEKTITSPFDFGSPAKSYDHAFNSLREQGGNYDYTLAYKNAGALTEAIYGYTVRESVDGGIKTQRQIYVSTFNETTGDIELDFCTFDDKPNSTTEDFGRRAYVSGNSLAHSFFIHFAQGGSYSSITTSVVGKGVSQGSGYFILATVDGNSITWYRLPAGATLGNFETVTGVSNIAQLDDPNGYAAELQTYIQSTIFTTRGILPTSLESFSNNGILVF